MKQLTIKTQITNRNDGSLDKYLKDISKLPQLTADEEAELAVRSLAGDEKAKDQLIKGNLRFVISVAKQYQHVGVPLVDIISAGNIGLIKAVGKFDPSRGFKLISYAVWWIRQSIQNTLSEHLKMIRLPMNCEKAINEYNRAKEQLEQKLGRDVNSEEVIDILALTNNSDLDFEETKSKSKFDQKKNKKELINTIYKPVSLDTPLADDSNSTLYDVLEHSEALSEMNQIDKDLHKQRLTHAFKTLTPLEVKILTLRYGLDGEGQRSYDEIGIMADLTGERIRQIQTKAFRKLKRIKNLKLFADDYLNI